mgnify:CR=1 FL=1
MAKKYWLYDGLSANAWDTASSGDYVHWRDGSPTGPVATALPAANDEVWLTGATAPLTGPGSSLTLDRFDTSLLTAASLLDAVTEDIVMSADGLLIMGTPGGSQTHAWAGTSTAALVAKFFAETNCKSASNASYAAFADRSQNTGTVGSGCSFTDAAVNAGTAGADALFTGSARNTGTVGDRAVFAAQSRCEGIAGDFSVFTDEAVAASSAIVGEDVGVLGQASIQGALVGVNARLHSTAAHYGRWGSPIYAMLSTRFIARSPSIVQTFASPTRIVRARQSVQITLAEHDGSVVII